MNKGFLSIVLHAHLPFVKHPEYRDSLEERWLFQAMSESYMPILNVLEKLLSDKVPYRVTVSLSPPLLDMLGDELLKERFSAYLETLTDLADKEVTRNSSDPHLRSLAEMYRNRFTRLHKDFNDKYRRDLISPWKALENAGTVELITSAATHGYLPLLLQKESVALQIETGVLAFRRSFGHTPKGFWLPECAYSPEVGPLLRKQGVQYFILETHGVLFASPRPKFGFHAPLVTPEGVLAFGRDPDCSKQVWSAEEGYPGDPNYREFYRDIGYELPLDYLGNALPGGHRAPTGIKYYRVTDRTKDHKELYDPGSAGRMAWEHAGNFAFWRSKEAEYWEGVLGRKPIMIAPYDAELFGHWWYEGPLWLEGLFRRLSQNENVKLIFPGEYVQYYPVNQIARPASSSWGYKGYHEVWLNDVNAWMYRHLHYWQDRVLDTCKKQESARGLKRRALDQAVREMLLAQSSDWPFIMKTGSLPKYAQNRFVNHLGRLGRLLHEISEGAIDPVFLNEVESRDSIFRGMDLSQTYVRAASGTS